MKVVLSLLGLAFLSLIFWAMAQKPLLESGAILINDPWGLVTLADLYLGFFIFSIFIFNFSKNKTSALLWSVALFFLGNIVPIIYILTNYNSIKNRIKG